MMQRAILWLSLAAAAVLGGCMLENPAPDSKLYYRFNHEDLQIWLDDTGRMDFSMDRDHDSIYVRAEYPVRSNLDSAEILIHGRNPYEPYSMYSYLRVPFFEDSPWEFALHTRIKPDGWPGRVVIGSRPNRLGSDLRDARWDVWVLRSWRGQTPVGNPFGGRYRGTYRKWDTHGKERNGIVRGLITANNEFTLEMQLDTGNDPWQVSTLSGTVDTAGLLKTYLVNPNSPQGSGEYVTAPAKAQVQGDSLAVKFIFNKLDLADSIEVRCFRVPAP